MTKLEFMKELESLLLDIPLEERDEALKYYNGYFEDAGEDQEDEIMKELGSPQKVASLIKADLNANADDRENRGYFTEKGYSESIQNEFEVANNNSYQSRSNYTNSDSTNRNNSYSNYNNSNQNKSYTNTSKSSSGMSTALVVILAIFTFPIWLPILLTVFGIAIGLITALFGIIFGFGVAGITMIVTGIALFIAGFVELTTPFIGLMMIGGGMIVSGLGMLITLAVGIVCKKVLPVVVLGFVNLCRLPFKNRRVMA